MFPPVDTKSPAAAAAFIQAQFASLFPGATLLWVPRLFQDVEDLFCGRHPDYGAVDLRYHDLEHTLQATVCQVLILAGRHRAGVMPRLTSRQFELSVAGSLLHDAGYLKLRSDRQGTGAKYTFCHVLRSCAFAASYLPTLGARDHEVDTVLSAINCTGPLDQFTRLSFREPVDRVIGCALATGDFLGQMAAPDYPDELDVLFEEFQESDDYAHVPAERRTFRSAEELKRRTPHFWREVVLPKLENDFTSVYHFLADPYPGGRNPYVEAVERNLAIIEARLGRPETSSQV